MWEPWLDGEREGVGVVQSQDHLSGGRMLCACVYPAAVFSIYLLKPCSLTCANIMQSRYMPLLV